MVVNNTEKTERGATVAFEGVHETLGRGIDTVRLSFYGDSATEFDPNGPAKVEVSGIVPVARVGDTPYPGVTISDVELRQGVNGVGRGEVRFRARTSDGNQEILLAEPQQVVWVNFDPTSTPL